MIEGMFLSKLIWKEAEEEVAVVALGRRYLYAYTLSGHFEHSISRVGIVVDGACILHVCGYGTAHTLLT